MSNVTNLPEPGTVRIVVKRALVLCRRNGSILSLMPGVHFLDGEDAKLVLLSAAQTKPEPPSAA